MKRFFFFSVMACLPVICLSQVSNPGGEISITGDGNTVQVDSLGQMHVVLKGRVDSNNSTTSTLAGNASYTGTVTDVSGYSSIALMCAPDVTNATRGLIVQFSNDQTNWFDGETYSVAAGAEKLYSVPIWDNYYRVIYNNGASAQSSFMLNSFLRKGASKWSSHNVVDSIADEDDAELVKAVISGKTPAGTFVNFQSSRRGNFRVAIDEYGDTPSIDPFDRLRVSENYTIFDSKQLHDKQPLFWDEYVSGSATSTHIPSNACTEMTVTASAGDFVVRQTKQRFNYQPGKGQLILLSFQGEQTNGLTKRLGAFNVANTNDLSPQNGVFLELDGTASWNIAKSGSITETATQANWNVDKLDGTGESGITIDFNDAQIAIIDYEWLGVGRVRVGFVLDGIIRYVHYFSHANNGFSSVYMSTPNLPLCYTIQTDGSVAGTLDHICSSVMSEGGIEETGILRSVNTGTAHVDADVADTSYAILGLKMKAAYSDITVIAESVSVMNEATDDFKWELTLNPTVAGAFTYNDVANSAIQYAKGATANTVTGGEIIDSGWVKAGNNSGSEQRTIKSTLRLGAKIDGTRDAIVLVVTPIAAGADIHGSLTIRELL